MTEAERDDVDLRVYAHRILSRWWIVAVCVVVTVVASLAGTSTGAKTYEGKSLVNLGLPLTPSGALVTGAYTNSPIFAQTFTRQPDVLAKAAAAAKLPDGALAGHVSVVPLASAVRNQASSQITLLVSGPFTASQAELATDSIATQLVANANIYPDKKKARLVAAQDRITQQIASEQQLLEQARNGLAQIRTLNGLEQAVTQSSYLTTIAATTSLLQSLQSRSDDLTAAIDNVDGIERAGVLVGAHATRADASSRRAELPIAIALGFVLGIILTLLSFVIRPARD